MTWSMRRVALAEHKVSRMREIASFGNAQAHRRTSDHPGRPRRAQGLPSAMVVDRAGERVAPMRWPPLAESFGIIAASVRLSCNLPRGV